MHSGGRRLLRRTQRRKRLLGIAAGVIISFVVVVLLLPSNSVPSEIPPALASPSFAPATPTAVPTTTQSLGHGAAGNTTKEAEDRQPEQGKGDVGDGGHNEQISTTLPAAHKGGLGQQYAEALEEMEALDLFPLRPGEGKVSFEKFADCLGAMLEVDPQERRETPRENPASTQELPMLISVTSGNTQDLKAMICNLSVAYKYVVLAQMGDTPEMNPFFDLLTRVFAFTKRLVVLQFKDSIGFAGAVNAGLREALRHPFDEVPFVHIIHNDVRFRHTALADSIRSAYLDVQADKAVIARLEAEVKTEPNAYTPLIRQPHGLRSPIALDGPLPQQSANASTLVTSALLPDRIRYLPEAERRRAFEGHVSITFHNSRAEYTSVYLSRLAVLTVGFFDENYYPVMFDDTDFRWRANMLGFVEYRNDAFDHSLVAFDLDCTNVRVDDDIAPGAQGRAGLVNEFRNNHHNNKPQLSPATKALMRECVRAFQRLAQFNYMAAKWGVVEFRELTVATPAHAPFASEAFQGRRHLPLDAWVVDTRRIAAVKSALLDTGVGGFSIEPYNPEVILSALP